MVFPTDLGLSNAGVIETPSADSDLRFRTLFDQAPFSVQLLSADGRTVAVNNAWEHLWDEEGQHRMKTLVLGGYNVLTDPQLEAKGVTPYLRRAFAGISTPIPAICYDPADIGLPGRPRWVKASAHPIRNDLGDVSEVMLIHEDVTEQIRSEEALRYSEERLRQLANSIPQPAWMSEADGRVMWYNDHWYDYTGISAETEDGYSWKRVVHLDELESVQAMRAQSLANGETVRFRVSLRSADADYRPFLVLMAPIKDLDGQVRHWFGTATDISLILSAQKELKIAEERLRLATDAGDIGIWEWDISSNTIIWSDRIYAIHGVNRDTFTLNVETYGTLIHPEDAPSLWAHVQTALSENSGFSLEFRALLPDGTARWLATWAKVEADGTGQRLIGAVINIDAHKKAEEALREGSRRKDEFLAMLAHELRNPLAPIRISADLLRLPNLDETRKQQTAEVISRQVGHMTKLIDDLMDVSRVTRGLVQLDRQVHDLKSLALTAVEQVRPLIETRGHSLRTHMEAGSVPVDGDRTRLVQIVSNLLNNSAKYTPSGGDINLEVMVKDDRAQVTISDTGEGISSDLMPFIFDLFTQGKRGLDRSQGGLGIGLALVKSLVEMHGGSVKAHSDGLGKGAEFTVCLPLTQRDRTSTTSGPQSSEAPATAGRRLVVVDDNIDAAQSLAMLLEASGHTVSVFHDAKAALDKSRALVADAFILDIGLPDMTGYDLARRLRALPELHAATLIALTGYGQTSDREQSRAAGFDHHLVKPVDPAILDAIIANLQTK